MQPISGNQRPDLLTALMNMSLVLRLPRKIHLCRSSSNVPRPPLFLEMPQNPHVLLTFGRVENPLRLPRKTTSERPKVLRTPQFFTLLTWKGASRHNGVQLSLIWPAGFAPAALASLLFDPPEPHIIGKAQCCATFPPFRAPGSSFFGDFLFLIFFLLFFSSLTLPISVHLSILSEV